MSEETSSYDGSEELRIEPDVITLLEEELEKSFADWTLEEWRRAAIQIRAHSDVCERTIAVQDLTIAAQSERIARLEEIHAYTEARLHTEIEQLRSRRVGRPRKKPVIKNHLMLWFQSNQKKPRGRPARWSNEHKQYFIRRINEIKESASIKTDKDAIDYFLKPMIASAIKRAKEVEHYRKLLPSLRKSVE